MRKPKLNSAELETLCRLLESGTPAWKLALLHDVQTPMIYHWYNFHRGYRFSTREAKTP